jgi:methylenetetrahydrofolate dehydrogenase (NADP+)/methenyltetrahydrofolate cyclohydrolase
MTLLDGKKIATQLKTEIKEIMVHRRRAGRKIPHLAAVLVGENPASMAYVRNKVKSCEEVGFFSTLVKKPETISEKELLQVVENLNNNPEIDGFIVQLPLPKHINEHRITLAIHPEKDVDGFHPVNLGKMMLGLPCFLSATPKGIMEMLHRYEIPTRGKHVVVVGRSNIVGTPMSILLSRKANPGDATVTLCHSLTHSLKSITLQADILIAAIGIPEFITGDMVKPGAVVIDVGINRVVDQENPKGFRLTGDVYFPEVAPKSAFISPVPGGVGQLTVMALIQNTLLAVERKDEIFI